MTCNQLSCSYGDSYDAILIVFLGINYFHCLKVLETLKDVEGGQKSIFGQYTSQRVKVMSHDVT